MTNKFDALADITAEVSRKQLQDLENKISSGVICSEEDLLKEIDKAWKAVETLRLESTMHIPAYKVGDLPMQADLESPLLQASDDIKTLHRIWSASLNRHKDLHNTVRAEVSGLDELLMKVQNNVARLQLFTSDSENLFVWSSDSFTSSDNIDPLQTNATIRDGMATLKVTSLSSLNSQISAISIDKTASVGIPGNNMEIASWSGPQNPQISDEPQVTLVENSDPHANIAYLFDSQPNSWFEWEYIHIPQTQPVKLVGSALKSDLGGESKDIKAATMNYGWTRYIQWPGTTEWDVGTGNGIEIVDWNSPKNSRIVFTITLKSPQKISAIQITPNVIGSVYPKVLSIEISSDKTKWETVAKDVFLTEKLNENLKSYRSGIPERNYTGTGIWTIPERTVQYIRFALEADGNYDAQLGHLFYYRVTKKHKSGGWFTKGKDWTEIERLPGKPSGIISDASSITNTQVLGTVLGGFVGSTLPGVGWLAGAALGGPLANAMFGGKVTSTVEEEGQAYDILAGKRSTIGLRDLDISLREYATEAQIVSRAHNLSKKVKAISIISTEEIPDGWDVNEEWIQFFVSPDGFNWTPIIPINRSKGKNDVAYFETDVVYVKILLRRPSNSPNATPILKNFAIKGTV